MEKPPAGEFPGTARFAVVRRIGAGGMGIVYEAHDRDRDARVALKTLPELDAQLLYLFKREFRALTDVIHPNLAALYELISVDGRWFYTMELIDGVDFLSHIRKGPPPVAASAPTTDLTAPRLDPATVANRPIPSSPAAEAPSDPPTTDPWVGEGAEPLTRSTVAPSITQEASVPASKPGVEALASADQFERLRAGLVQLTQGLCALHQAGKLHRDIKPSNILVTPLGRVVILDFGLVVNLEPGAYDATGEPGVAGTIGYMAPEQIAGKTLSPASDWYAVGVILYAALTGRMPYRGSVVQVMQDKQHTDARPPAEAAPTAPDDLNRLCIDLLCRDPHLRPGGAEILQRLTGRSHEQAAPRLPFDAQQAAFVGRGAELAALQDAFDTVCRGNPVTIDLHGRSGVGKSTLVQRFLDELHRHFEVVVLAGQCYEQESVPYKALDSLVDALTRYLRRLSALEVVAVLPRDIAALARLFPVLLRVEAIEDAPQQGAHILDPQELRRRAFAALRELLARLGDRKRVVVVIDDLQWGDSDSAALLADLFRPPDPPVLCLLCIYRSEYREVSPCLQALWELRASGAAHADWREVVVEPLTPAESGELARLLLNPRDAALLDRAEAVAREAGGSPYFVRELVQSLREGGSLADPAAQGKVTLDDVLWTRITGLPDAARRLLEIIGLAGRPLTQGNAYRAAGLNLADRVPLSLLRAGHLARGSGPSEKDEVTTFHDRVRETVVARLTEEMRRAHHLALATTLEKAGTADPETLALHFHGAGDIPAARRYYTAAADEATQALAFDRAAKLYRLSLDLLPQGAAEDGDLRAKLGNALACAGRGADAARIYLEAAAGASGQERLELERRAAHQYLVSGRADAGRDAMAAVLGHVGLRLPTSPGRALVSLLFRRFVLWLRGLRFREQPAAAVPAEELMKLDILWSTSVGLTVLDTIRAADFQTRNLLQALRSGEPLRLGRALAWEAAHAGVAGVSAQRTVDRLLAMARDINARQNSPYLDGLITLATGTAAYFRGHWKESNELSERAEKIFRDNCTDVAWEIDTAQSFRVWALVMIGTADDLTKCLPLWIKEARERGDLYVETNIATFAAPVFALSADDPDGGERMVREAMGRWSQRGFHSQHYLAMVAQVQIELYRGNPQAAWDRLSAEWATVSSAMLMRVQAIRIKMHSLRARCALQLVHRTTAPRQYLRVAEADARRLERENAPWSQALAGTIRAGLAELRGDKAAAAGLFGKAAEELEAIGMHLFAAASRWRHGELLGGAAGEELIRSAAAWMRGQNIQQPRRLASIHVPGFHFAP